MYEIGRHYLRGQSVRRLGKMSNRQQAELSDTDCGADAVAHGSFGWRHGKPVRKQN